MSYRNTSLALLVLLTHGLGTATNTSADDVTGKWQLNTHRKQLEAPHRVAKQLVSTTVKPPNRSTDKGAKPTPKIPESPPAKPRNDIHISGIYPHLTAYGVYSQNGAHYKTGHNECGIGAIVPWADQLWMVNYAPHQHSSEHKLYSIDKNFNELTVHPESVGGTPAGRMIHEESKQLLIAHYLIDESGKIRVISPKDMPMRVTAIARHLTDPANRVYYIDMEGSIWEANVHTLAVKRLFKKPVPGWHGKGGYTSQGRLVVTNNGELQHGNYDDLVVGGKAKHEEERGVLAEYDGKNWKIIERRQFTDVTGPKGITGGSDGDDPLWTMGWDRRSVRLKVLDQGKWSTYLLPKAALCNDAFHGWYTEWPRIREITDGRWMMDMHGMFFDFPKTFSSTNTAGLKPIGSHLRYIPDFCAWNDKLVLASDETSIQGNPLAGQPQTNLWIGDAKEIKDWGPASGYGGPWVGDEVTANTPSDPFLVAGFDRRVIHLAVGQKVSDAAKSMRVTGQMPMEHLSEKLTGLPLITIERGNWRKPAQGFSFDVDRPVTVYLAVDGRGNQPPGPGWKQTDLSLSWQHGEVDDVVYARDFAAGTIVIPPNENQHKPGSYGLPHAAFVDGNGDHLQIDALKSVVVTQTPPKLANSLDAPTPVTFTLQIDANGTGQWQDYRDIEVPADGYVSYSFPSDFNANWLRLMTSRDCVATAVVHQTTSTFADPKNGEMLFAGLADVAADNALGSRTYPAQRNRDLRVIADGDRFFNFGKATFEYQADEVDESLQKRLEVKPEFTVDKASVVLMHNGRKLRLPKGNAAFDKPFASGWPRDSREVESERHLANFHGTFYEVPLLLNGKPPAFELMRPVASHNKQISDYCTWNGLLVLSGVRKNAEADDHVFINPAKDVGLWLGGIDDLWKFGKPVGIGGPWKNTPVTADEPSDPYLMTGYDSKTLTLSSDVATVFTIEVDFDHQTGFHAYKEVVVEGGTSLTFQFPDAFSAHWVRLRSSKSGTATAQFVYR
ncbi:hypothetical protein SAMN06265222_105250 [Neorhodopirellula lusitana]|uniref:Uncharacterized protein n=1 Tax=Neorhodopirellula lusitana TaxID=445327 RepID=A0ABY1Q697_9BACT|nr:hypothetical protein [Neorhodopirellula lusitana]SMP57032.1 hypothetical protein SAMN06265222_105250 [Neorhodopirellula lusitana]